MNEYIKEAGGLPAAGPYSQAVKAGGFLFVSGQLPLDPATGGIVAGDVRAQARQSLENLKTVLETAGYTLPDAVKTTVLLAHIEDFAAVNEIYAAYFQGSCPARACYAVNSLPKGALVEIELIAHRD